MSIKYDAETKARAVRLVTEHAGDYDTEWAAITAISKRLGMTPETPATQASPSKRFRSP
jgi:transposase